MYYLKIVNYGKRISYTKCIFRGETDNFLTEAGGGSELPKWVNDTAISVNAERVYDQLELFSELFSDANRTMPVLTEITLNKKQQLNLIVQQCENDGCKL